MRRSAALPASGDAHLRDIIAYYDHTRYDYDQAWLRGESLAVHFGFYDCQHRRHLEALENTNKVLARLAGITAGERVLDAGCGRGGSAIWLAKHKKAEVVGVTPVRTQVEEAQRQATLSGYSDQLQFLEGDYCETGLSDASFDVVWACESLCHAEDKAAFYQEAARLLRPGGRLIVAEYVRYGRPYAADQERLLLSWLNAWAIPDIDTTEEHTRHIATAGLVDASVQDYTRYTWISLKNLHKISRRWLWADYLLYGLGVRRREQHQNILGSIRQYQALRGGLWYYALLQATKPVL